MKGLALMLVACSTAALAQSPETGKAEVKNAQGQSVGEVTLTETLKPGVGSLFKEGGTAIVVHGGADDYRSDPAGNAGPRIACGVITH